MNATETEYTKIRDRIETVAALTAAAQRGVEHLDLDVADSLSDEVRLETAAGIWGGLMNSLAAIDR